MASGADKIDKNLKLNVRKYRKERKLTQFELGVQADITEDYVRAIEAGKRSPSLKVLGKLADALGVEPCQLIE